LVTQVGHRPKSRQTRRGSRQTCVRSVASLTGSAMPLTLASGRVGSGVDVRIGRNWLRWSCRDYGPLRAHIVESSRSKPVESIINLHLLCSIKSVVMWMCVCLSPSTVIGLTMSVVGNREFCIAS